MLLYVPAYYYMCVFIPLYVCLHAAARRWRRDRAAPSLQSRDTGADLEISVARSGDRAARSQQSRDTGADLEILVAISGQVSAHVALEVVWEPEPLFEARSWQSERGGA